jgi:hypothetical protein
MKLEGASTVPSPYRQLWLLHWQPRWTSITVVQPFREGERLFLHCKGRIRRSRRLLAETKYTLANSIRVNSGLSINLLDVWYASLVDVLKLNCLDQIALISFCRLTRDCQAVHISRRYGNCVFCA